MGVVKCNCPPRSGSSWSGDGHLKIGSVLSSRGKNITKKRKACEFSPFVSLHAFQRRFLERGRGCLQLISSKKGGNLNLQGLFLISSEKLLLAESDKDLFRLGLFPSFLRDLITVIFGHPFGDHCSLLSLYLIPPKLPDFCTVSVKSSPSSFL